MAGILSMLKNYIKVIRPKSWLKNIFVFVPLVYSLQLFNVERLLQTLAAFLGFCLISSSVYIFNDISDAEKDALHPTKKFRPISSGAISKGSARFVMVLLIMSGLALIYTITNTPTVLFAIIYLNMNIAYTIYLKHKPIIDCFCIAAGFVLRIYAGGAAANETVSDWLFLTIIAASLFMAFGKRRGEMLLYENNKNASGTREVLEKYDLNYLIGMVFVCAGLSVVFYSLWALDRGNDMVYTVPLIIFIVLKYLLLIHDKKSGSKAHGDPTTVIFDDRMFILACGLYVALTVYLLYRTGGN